MNRFVRLSIALSVLAVFTVPLVTQRPGTPARAYDRDCLYLIAPGADLSDCDFSYADLRGVDFSNATLDNTNFTGANLAGANLSGVTAATSAVFLYADLRSANLSASALVAPSFYGALLAGAQGTNSSWTNADLRQANVEKLSINGTTLVGVRSGGTIGEFSDTIPNRVYFQKFGYVFGPKADLSFSSVTGSDTLGKLLGSDLTGINFTGAKITSIGFSQANLRGAIFRNANLNTVSFIASDLQGADFSGATYSNLSYLSSTCPSGELVDSRITPCAVVATHTPTFTSTPRPTRTPTITPDFNATGTATAVARLTDIAEVRQTIATDSTNVAATSTSSANTAIAMTPTATPTSTPDTQATATASAAARQTDIAEVRATIRADLTQAAQTATAAAPTRTPTATATPNAGVAWTLTGATTSSNGESPGVVRDGSLTSAWRTKSTVASPSTAWVAVSLGQARSVAQVRWNFRFTGLADSFIIQSNSSCVAGVETGWTTRGPAQTNAPVGAWQSWKPASAFTACQVRFLFTNTGNDPRLGGLAEIQVMRVAAAASSNRPAAPTATKTATRTPTATRTLTPSPTRTVSPTPSRTATQQPSATPSPQPTVTPTPVPPSPSPTATLEPSATADAVTTEESAG